MLPVITPWVSTEDIQKGTRWGTVLAKELEDTFYGVICLTPNNIREPWILFEAGALSKTVGESRVFPLLFGVTLGHLPGPLAQFQATTYEKEDVRKFMHSLNEAAGYQTIPPDQLNRVFEYSWHGLQAKLDPLLKKALKHHTEVSKGVSESVGPPTLLESVLAEVEGTVSAKRARDTRLHPMDIQILQDLYAIGDERLTIHEVARFLKCDEQKALYFLDKLRDRGLIEGRQYVVDRPEEYSLTKRGRAFTIEEGLV